MSSNIGSQMISCIVVVMFVFTVSSQRLQTEAPSYDHILTKHDGDFYEISFLPGSLYKFYTTKKTFADAQATCEQEGANLVSVHSHLYLRMQNMKVYMNTQADVSIRAS